MEKEDIVKIINSYPWRYVNGQMRKCDNLNVYLIGLLSSNEIEQDESYWQLDNNIVVQSGLYDGAFYVIPFLVAFLKMDFQFNANKVFDLLFEISKGETDELICYSVKREGVDYFFPASEEHNTESITISLSIACRNEVLKNFSVYLEEFKTNRLQSRELALDLMCSFEEHQYFVVTSIRKVCDELQDNHVSEMAESMIKEYYGDI